MTNVLDEKIGAIIAEHGWIKVLMTVLFAFLTYEKGKGNFQKKDGPAGPNGEPTE